MYSDSDNDSDCDEEFCHDAFPIVFTKNCINPIKSPPSKNESYEIISFDDDVMVMTTAGTPYHQVGEYFNIRDNWTRKFLGIAVVIGTFDGSNKRKTGEVPDDDIEQVVLK
jgi:hypothetical protein